MPTGFTPKTICPPPPYGRGYKQSQPIRGWEMGDINNDHTTKKNIRISQINIVLPQEKGY